MLILPDVTLVLVDTISHELGRLAVEDCMKRVDYDDVLVFSDKKSTAPNGTWFMSIDPLGSKHGYDDFVWYQVPKHVKTSHYLIAQWDGWVYRPDCWEDRFLQYDYIGAPWMGDPKNNVGNGGFSLRSRDLGCFLAAHPDFPCKHPEDSAICHDYRHKLEERGYRFADMDTAQRFSFECIVQIMDRKHFGFHNIRNWPFVLTEGEIEERLKHANDYIRSMTADFQHMAHIKDIIRSQGLPFGYMSHG